MNACVVFLRVNIMSLMRGGWGGSQVDRWESIVPMMALMGIFHLDGWG
jgi:hypothetical protein